MANPAGDEDSSASWGNVGGWWHTGLVTAAPGGEPRGSRSVSMVPKVRADRVSSQPRCLEEKRAKNREFTKWPGANT